MDIQTVEALRNGDHKAFERLFIAYFNKTKIFINGYIKSEAEAEELAEELFVNLWINREKIDPSKSFNAYLHTIAHHVALNFLKHKLVEESYLTSLDTTAYTSTSEEEVIAKELGLFIDEVVDNMPEQRKHIYLLSRQEGLNNQEIAERLHTTKRNVESQLSLALKEIRKAITLYLLVFL